MKLPPLSSSSIAIVIMSVATGWFIGGSLIESINDKGSAEISSSSAYAKIIINPNTNIYHWEVQYYSDSQSIRTAKGKESLWYPYGGTITNDPHCPAVLIACQPIVWNLQKIKKARMIKGPKQ